MKSKFFLSLVMLGSANLAMAADTITFQGEIVDNTCAVKVGTTATAVVQLPKIGKASLSSVGKTAGATPFTITVSDCKVETNGIKVRFIAHNPDGNNLGLTTGSSTAKGVSVQLLNGNAGSSPINFQTGVALTDVADTTSGTTSYNLTAQYYANKEVEPGTVTAVTDYEVVYP